jgi:hypothetical protein
MTPSFIVVLLRERYTKCGAVEIAMCVAEFSIEVAVHRAVGMRANTCQNACPHVSLHLFMFDDGARRWRANGAADCGTNFSAIHAANFNANICPNIYKRHRVKRILTRNATHRSIASARGKYQT